MFKVVKSSLAVSLIASIIFCSFVIKNVNGTSCDIYGASGFPCVAAHSVVRALYSNYSGPLYQVHRASDNQLLNIPLLATGGYANSSVQDHFCFKTYCFISIIYDQSPMKNHLALAPAGGEGRTPDIGVNATRHKLTIGPQGNIVYGAFFETKMGYRNDTTKGIAKGDQPESMYMVASGTHYNQACCFDYGNAETNNNDDGSGTMEAVYFGGCGYWGRGAANGPWVMADLENGLFAGNVTVNYNNHPLPFEFVTAMVKGKAGKFCLKGANAQSGSLTTFFEGPRPKGYEIMKKQGAIILGIGGDNSNSAIGTFYEGVITQGYSDDRTDNLVQQNIINARYHL